MEVLKFVLNNIDNLISLVAIGFMCYLVIKNGTKGQIVTLVISLMMESEKIYGGGTGTLKKEVVLNNIPVIYKLLYNKKYIQKLIDENAEKYKALFDKISEN